MMNKLVLTVILTVISVLQTLGQQATPTPILYTEKTLSELKVLQKAALQSDYALNQTAYLCNNIGPRLSGSPQAQRAVEYVADEMRKLGLDVRLQKLSVPHWIRGEEKGALIEFPGMAPGTTQKIVLVTLAGSAKTAPGGLTAEIVVVNSLEEMNAVGREKIQGKIVLLNNRFDREMANTGYGRQAFSRGVVPRFRSAIEAARLGAAGILVRSVGSSQRLAHAGTVATSPNVPQIPSAAVSNEDAELIVYLTKMGRVVMNLLLTPQTLPNATSYNVIADLKGSEKPDEIVVVTGHLDSWDLGTGALDDAVGVTTSMQVPFLLKQLNFKPKRTIRFIAHMNEENGVVGGNTYAREEDANMPKHFASIESDLGASHPVGVLFAGKPELRFFLAPLSNILSDQGAGISEHQPRGGGVGALGGNLNQKGVPAFAPWFNTRTFFNYHHTAADTFDKVNPKELAESGAVVAVLAYGLANLEQPLPR